jgi:hypothetical protein
MNQSPTAAPVSPTREHIQRALDDATWRWQRFADAPIADGDLDGLRSAHAELLAHAERISGTSTDAIKRAVIYYSIYEDSRGNFMFPLIATHGSLWGVHHTLRIERWLQSIESASRHGRIRRWIDAIDAVRDINRRVFVEIYTTFYFTRYFGQHPLAFRVIHPRVLDLYNRVHKAIRDDRPLDEAARRDIYYRVFIEEQNHIVDPGIQMAAAAADSPWLTRICGVVQPRFRYFPPGKRLHFTDFTNVDQRNRQGLRALAFAEQVGAERVLEAMNEYDL